MEITYTKEDVKILIEKYYQETESRNVEVEIITKKELTGLYETTTCVNTIKIKERTTLLGRPTTIEQTINKDDIKNIFSEILKDTDFTLESLEYNEGIRQECVGYYMNEHMEYRPYFDGITLKVSKNNLLKKRK